MTQKSFFKVISTLPAAHFQLNTQKAWLDTTQPPKDGSIQLKMEGPTKRGGYFSTNKNINTPRKKLHLHYLSSGSDLHVLSRDTPWNPPNTSKVTERLNVVWCSALFYFFYFFLLCIIRQLSKQSWVCSGILRWTKRCVLHSLLRSTGTFLHNRLNTDLVGVSNM